MTEFIPEKKGTILSIAGKINHLHVICTNPFFCADIGAMAIIAVNISSIKENVDYDKTCVLHVGDHPFIKHDSYVRYKDATAMKVENILEKISHREITVLENLSDEVFERVFAGFEKSEYTSRKIKKQLRVAAGARKAL